MGFKNVNLYLNKNAEKSLFDRILIRKNYVDRPEGFSVLFWSDLKEKGFPKSSAATTIHLETDVDVLEYIEDVFRLIDADIDKETISTVDVMFPEYPIVCLNTKNPNTKSLILRILKTWCRRDHGRATGSDTRY